MKLVVNRCYGGFGLSHQAMLEYLRRKGLPAYWVVDEITLKYHPAYNPDRDEGGVVHYGTQSDFMSEDNPGYVAATDIPRGDPLLIQIVEELGPAANGHAAKLEVVEIPDGIEWEIEEHDGYEHVAEVHRTW